MFLIIVFISFVILIAGINIYYMYWLNKNVNRIEDSISGSLINTSLTIQDKISSAKRDLTDGAKLIQVFMREMNALSKMQINIEEKNVQINEANSTGNAKIIVILDLINVVVNDILNLNKLILENSSNNLLNNDELKTLILRTIQNGQNVNERIISIQKQLGIIK